MIIHDFVDSVTIDRSTNSDFVISSVRGSVFVRNCTHCRFVVVSGQFRCRDCSDCDFYLQVKTGPVIEASQELRIGCGLVSYDGLYAHMDRAKLDPAVNPWNDVHDFTPGGGHFTLQPGRLLDLPINPIASPLLVFTWGSSLRGDFAAALSREQLPVLARASVEAVKVLRTEKGDDGRVHAVIAGDSLEAVQAALAPIAVNRL